MWSYPSDIPLSSQAVRGVWNAIRHFEFEELFGSKPGRVIRADGKRIVLESTKRYLKFEGQEEDKTEAEIV